MKHEPNPYDPNMCNDESSNVLWPIVLAIFTGCFYAIGAISTFYCLLMILWPELIEGIAVGVVSIVFWKQPQSGDYRFAWKPLYIAIPVAIAFVGKLIIKWMFASRL